MLSQLESYPKIITHVIKYEHRLKGSVEQFKAIVQLVDGSRLHINEMWVNSELTKYAYYWLNTTDKIIHSWDNAPHHPEISTHPHHLHISGKVYVSKVQQFSDVIEFFKHQLRSRTKI